MRENYSRKLLNREYKILENYDEYFEDWHVYYFYTSQFSSKKNIVLTCAPNIYSMNVSYKKRNHKVIYLRNFISYIFMFGSQKY